MPMMQKMWWTIWWALSANCGLTAAKGRLCQIRIYSKVEYKIEQIRNIRIVRWTLSLSSWYPATNLCHVMYVQVQSYFLGQMLSRQTDRWARWRGQTRPCRSRQTLFIWHFAPPLADPDGRRTARGLIWLWSSQKRDKSRTDGRSDSKGHRGRHISWYTLWRGGRTRNLLSIS